MHVLDKLKYPMLVQDCTWLIHSMWEASTCYYELTPHAFPSVHWR